MFPGVAQATNVSTLRKPLPNTILVQQYLGLSGAEMARLTARARRLSKGDLMVLSKGEASSKFRDLTVGDLKSLVDVILGRFASN